ncbi:MAG TPA: GxxExxY protein [Vicinamibacterales bacterium]|nr:GxxExxY protein [Vicinamibacterales bacterium]
MLPNEVSYKVIGAAMAVHSALGSGLLESAYEKALCHELTRMGLKYRCQVQLPVEYGGAKIFPAYRIDFVVEDCVVVEIKAIEKILPVHRMQLLSYIKLAKLPLGLLINFKVAHLKDGICRQINAPEAEL